MENIASSISLPSELEEKIKRLARERGQTKNSLIQEAMRQFIEKKEIEEIERKMQAKARTLGIESDEDVVELIHHLREEK